MACINKDFNFIHGDTHTVYFSVPRITGVTIGNLKIYYTVKKQQNGKVLLQKTLQNGGITLLSYDDEKYHCMLTFTNGCTDCLKSNTQYVHDIELVYNGFKQTLLKGYLTLDEEVTTTKCEC